MTVENNYYKGVFLTMNTKHGNLFEKSYTIWMHISTTSYDKPHSINSHFIILYLFIRNRAKVYRDELMFRYHDEFPQYDFLNNVGYGTKKHLEAIKKFGICKYHRKTFLKNYI